MKCLQKSLGSVALPGLLLVGCGVQEAEVLEQATQEMELMSTSFVSVQVTGAWPKTATWTSDHPSCGSHSWNVSWASSPQSTSGNQITRSPTSEACGIWAGVAVDAYGHTSSNAPSTNVIDSRSISMQSSHTVPVGSAPSLTVPTPHRTRHCGSAGSFIFQVYNQSQGVWYDVAQSQNVSPWRPTAPTPGYEIYRVKCTYPGVTAHYSNNITVTWTSSDPNSCNGYCEGSAPGGCYCDSACECMGDCCSDYFEYCAPGGANLNVLPPPCK